MPKTIRWQWIGAMSIAVMAIVLDGNSIAQEKKKPGEKHDGAVLNQTARDVINTGAKLFNDQGDHAGCYRLYQGSLLTMRSFVGPELQKSIDQGLSAAEKRDNYADRAFELRRVLDEIRAATKGGEKKEEKKKKGKNENNNDDDRGEVAGKVLYQGKPIAGGYFVTLVSAKGKAFSSAIQKDGTFRFKTPIPTDDYRVAIERIPAEELKGATVPTHYGSTETSGLGVRVRAGKQVVDLNLVK